MRSTAEQQFGENGGKDQIDRGLVVFSGRDDECLIRFGGGAGGSLI